MSLFKSKATFLLTAVALLSSFAFAADEFKVDPVQSSATFTVKHMLISNVSGRFSNVTGTIVYDEKDLGKSSVHAVIKAATINTDNPGRDADLKGADFFEADKYPDITFKSKRIEKRGDQLVAIGTLTMKDVSKDIEVSFEIATLKTAHGTRLGVTASTKLNRQDYHIKYSKTLDNGGMMVANDVRIELNLEAQAAAPKAAEAAAAK